LLACNRCAITRSGSISRVPVIRANSVSLATSALELAGRVISIPKIAPTSPY